MDTITRAEKALARCRELIDRAEHIHCITAEQVERKRWLILDLRGIHGRLYDIVMKARRMQNQKAPAVGHRAQERYRTTMGGEKHEIEYR